MSEQNLAEQVSALTERHGGMIPVAEYMRMSTDHQRYSIEFQCGAIRKYAVQHGMSVVRTYLDPGKSGLTLKGRLGLQSLLKDVISGNINYGAILVYDVSRWGRFQDTDEAAYYEFMCKQAGVKVIYCAELFDDTPMGGLFKNIKRVMAGEFSRSQSARVWGAQAQSVAAGHKPGGAAGYGFRRLLVSPEGKPKAVLENRQYKMLTADKVVLIPGPVIERETVWWIYDSYIFDRKSAEQIAIELNRNLNSQRKWTRHRVHSVLFNRKYTGACLFNRLSRKLKTRTTKNPEGMWIRRDRAFVGLVSNEYFDLVEEIKKANKKKPRWDEAELRAQLKKLLKEKGHLSANLIDSVPGTACAQTFINYFGSMRAAFASVGYCSLTRRTVGLWNKQREEHERTIINELLALLMAASIKADWDSKDKILWVSTDKTIAVAVLIFRAYWYHERWVWHIEKMHKREFDQCLAVRMDSSYKAVLDYHLFPHASLWSIPKNTVVSDSKPIAPFKVAGLRVLVSKWKRRAPVTASTEA